MTDGTGRPAAAKSGRPRSEEVDQRLLTATVQIYLESGFTGLTFESVARRAGVGKPALYRRWSSREELLVAALEHDLPFDQDSDTGSLRTDLLALAAASFAWSVSDAGAAYVRVRVDVRSNEALRTLAWDRLVRTFVASSRLIIARAIDRGELPPTVDANLILELVGGAVRMRLLNTAWTPAAGSLELDQEYATELVDLVLAGIARTTPALPSTADAG